MGRNNKKFQKRKQFLQKKKEDEDALNGNVDPTKKVKKENNDWNVKYNGNEEFKKNCFMETYYRYVLKDEF